MQRKPADWHTFPSILLATPTLSIAIGTDAVWVGGTGGVVRTAQPLDTQSTIWQTCISGLPLSSITALTFVDGWLFAGGPEGIARSSDGGETWHRAQIDGDVSAISAIVVSPHFADNTTALAASLDGGIVRTSNAGRTWSPVTFGLHDFEVTALLWPGETTVLAATADGVYRSPNAGRAWRAATGTEGVVIAALAMLANGCVLAATETGELLHSENNGADWTPHASLPPNVVPTVLLAAAEMILLGTAEHGIFRSLDDGHTWQPVQQGTVLALAAYENMVVAGLDSSILVSDDHGQTWAHLPEPPSHDLRKLIVAHDQPLLWGRHTGLVRLNQAREWTVVSDVQPPIHAVALLPGDAIYESTNGGCKRSMDSGQTWEQVSTSTGHVLSQLTFRPNGLGWASSLDGTHLFRTVDNGAQWETLSTPFGVVPLIAIQALPDLLIAATYDSRRQVMQLWRSLDDGATWLQGAQAQTPWPIMPTWATPPVMAVSGTIMHQGSNGEWLQSMIGPDSGLVRSFAGDAQYLFALTTTGIYRSTDAGGSWLPEPDTLPVEQILDITVAGDTLYVLLTGGQVWARSLSY